MNEIDLSIIIPLYNTPEKFFRECLDSIDKQTILDTINYEILIIDDYSSKDYSEIYKDFYNLNIKILKQAKNSGPGFCRNVGVKEAKGRYITFVDADDKFYDDNSLSLLYNVTKTGDYDLVCGRIEEQLKNKTSIQLQRGYIWCFARLYKLSFLQKEDINFNYTRANEDVSFTTLCYFCTDKIYWIDKPVYKWCYNDTSITRTNNCSYKYDKFNCYIENMIWTYEEAKKRNIEKEEKSLFQFTCIWIRIYLQFLEVFQKFGFEAAIDILKIGEEYYEKVYSIIRTIISSNDILSCYSNMVKTSVNTIATFMPNVSFPEFEYRIMNKAYGGFDSRFGFYLVQRGDDNGDMDK